MKAYLLIIDKGIKNVFYFEDKDSADQEGYNQKHDYIIVPVNSTAAMRRMFDFEYLDD